MEAHSAFYLNKFCFAGKLCLTIGFCAAILSASPVLSIAPDAITDKFHTLDSENQRLAGSFANRLRANSEGLLEHIDVAVLLAPYNKGASGNNGELAGRYLQAAAHAYEGRQQPELRAAMDRVVNALAKAQAKDGYLGTASESERMSADDLHVQRANLLGLLAYYEATGGESAYTVAQKIGDLLVEKLKSGELKDPLGGAGLAEPMVMLYRYTAEPAYVGLAKALAKVNDSVEAPVEDHLAYYASLAELYRISGEEIYLRAATRGWANMAGTQLSITGAPAAKSAGQIDNCVTSLWVRLTLELMRLTGSAKYGDNLEKIIYNHVFAGQDIRNGDVCAITPETGKKDFLSRQRASLSPCALAEADGLALISQTIWGRYGNGIAINSYNPGRGSFQLRRRALIQIYLESSYPVNGEILLHVEPSRHARFPLRLRVPEWADNFTADFGTGSHLIGQPGEYLVIEREWTRGDVVKIAMNMRAQILKESERIAIKRGPEVLVAARSLNQQIRNLNRVALSVNGGVAPELNSFQNKLPQWWAGEEAYQMKCEYEGDIKAMTLVPFADATDYQTWFERQQEGSSRALPD